MVRQVFRRKGIKEIMKIIMAYLENFSGLSGGLEKILCEFSNEMEQRGHEVSIVTYDERTGKPFYLLKEDIHIFNIRQYAYDNLGIRNHDRSMFFKIQRESIRILGKNIYRQWKADYKSRFISDILNEYIQTISPDIVISYNQSTTYELDKIGVKCPIISMFHNDPDILLQKMTKKEKRAIQNSEVIQVLTEDFKIKLQKYFLNSNIVCIPNVIIPSSNTADLSKEKKQYKIIDVARINKEQKRQHLLIEAFAKLAKNNPQWILEFWGDTGNANYMNQLRNRVSYHDLENRIFFKGTTKDIQSVYLNADLFCFPSKYEGFGLSLGEALSAGLPAIAFKSCSAVKDLINNGLNGILVDDGIDHLADALQELMLSREKRIKMGYHAHLSMEKYEPHNIWDRWNHLVINIFNEFKNRGQET